MMTDINDVDIISLNDIIEAKYLVDYFMEQIYSLGGITIYDIRCKCINLTITESENEVSPAECEYCKYLKEQNKDLIDMRDQESVPVISTPKLER